MTPQVPAAYLDYLERHGTFEGFVGGDAGVPGYVELWAADSIAGSNDDIGIGSQAPGFVAFAGNGGGEVLAFDAAGRVYMLPLIGMQPDCAMFVADSFADFAARFQVGA